MIDQKILEEVINFLRMPSVSGTGEGIEKTASYLRDWISDRLNASVGLLRYGGHPIVYGKLDSKAEKTLIFYSMYDVQPVEPLDKWISPPFEAKVIDGNIIARGAYNTKGALMSTLLGMERLLKEDKKLPVNIIFIIEGEEELGSPSMPKLIEDKMGELKIASGAFFTIPSEFKEGKARITLGNKGIVFVELKCRVSEFDVHSSYSRGLINPVAVLSKIISELIDPIHGPKLTWLEDKTVTPDSDDLEYLGELIESSPMEEIIENYKVKLYRSRDWYIPVHFKPTVNVDGIYSGYVGKGTKTILPSEAVARLDFRIVPNIEPKDVIEGLKNLIEGLGLKGLVELEVKDSYTWSKTSPKNPIVKAARNSLTNMNIKPYIMTMLPGSAPGYLFTRKLNIPMVYTAPGKGGRAHAPNEYITMETPQKIVQFTSYFLKEFSTYK